MFLQIEIGRDDCRVQLFRHRLTKAPTVLVEPDPLSFPLMPVVLPMWGFHEFREQSQLCLVELETHLPRGEFKEHGRRGFILEGRPFTELPDPNSRAIQSGQPADGHQ